MALHGKVALALGLALPLMARAADVGDAGIISRLSESKLSLIEGIEQAEKASGFAISAKFELEDGKLWLSVYAAKDGREKDAEQNTLIELKGEPGAEQWKPNTEVFEDKKHLTRSAAQLTLMQPSKWSLVDIIKRASASQEGTAYSAIPAIKDGRPVVRVCFAAPGGKKATVAVDLVTGKTR